MELLHEETLYGAEVTSVPSETSLLDQRELSPYLFFFLLAFSCS
ncbi:hypothetical protein [Adhaeribacter radiodurans]|nr:hypothetical protein [Adhaeribacter radiodurans]